MLHPAVVNRSRPPDSEVLPAIALDVTPTPPGLRHLAAKLTTFAYEHDLPESDAPGSPGRAALR